MKMLRYFYILSSFMWGMFSVAAIGLLFKQLSLERFVLFSVLFIATLLEELYYLIKEKIIDADKIRQ